MSEGLFSGLQAAIGLILIVSIASERLVEIVKGIVPWLNTAFEDAKLEGKRRSALQFLAVISGIITAYISSPFLSSGDTNISNHPEKLLAIGLLASGGSGFWNAILNYLLQIKDLKKEEVSIARSNTTLQQSGVFPDLKISDEQVTSNSCYNVGE
jgi:ubiquitin C-terminal hydrolase